MVKKNKTTLVILVSIIILAALLRLYRISDYMTFLGDEGRDVLIVKDILQGNFTFLGPRSSAGDFYTGPIYYYMMAPFLWLFRLDPVGPAVMIALLGIVTVFLVYYVGRKWFNQQVGLIAAALYAVSPLVLTYSRSSWNPNPMPFFTLLLLYFLYQAVQNKSYKYFVGTGVLYGVALQLHYIELFVGVTIFCFTLFSFFYLKRKNIVLLIKQYLLLLIGFVIGFSPFLAFEFRHSFPNTRAIFDLALRGSPNATDLTNLSFIQIVQDVFFRVFARTLWAFPTSDKLELVNKNILLFWQIIIIGIAFAAIYLLIKYKNKLVTTLVGLWIGQGILFFGFYKKPINDYNFEFLFPVPFLLIAYLIYKLYTYKRFVFFAKVGAIMLFLFLFGHSLYNSPFRKEPNRQKEQIKTISEFVISKSGNKPYNFALLTPGNSDHGYRFYFDILGKPPVRIDNPISDPDRTTVTEQLLIVCEEKNCKPLGHPLFDVAGFGRAQIDGEWDVSVVKVYRLVPYKNE